MYALAPSLGLQVLFIVSLRINSSRQMFVPKTRRQ